MVLGKVAIKGMGEELVLTLGQGELDSLLAELDRELEDKGDFFRGGQMTLRTEFQELSSEDVERIEALLDQHQISLKAVHNSPSSHSVRPQLKVAPQAPGPSRGLYERSSGLLIHGTLRSGQLISHSGHVVIIGDVNPGAKVIAEGDIVIWGKLRGTAHAGAEGDEEAVICALQLAPIQLRIAGHIARSPDRREETSTEPEIARVIGDRIVAEPWSRSKIIY
ncbi:MAG: septum site-determining protein MinC [Chloroflexota bacterium]|nr:septum site-determining protein MinC [Chloroflexota bacterium]